MAFKRKAQEKGEEPFQALHDAIVDRQNKTPIRVTDPASITLLMVRAMEDYIQPREEWHKKLREQTEAPPPSGDGHAGQGGV